ncbi:hypothetical protein A1O7_04290 [Cladophialophora yegresii CBS 114405]|uniref:Uncharacterized protein n=1 Tax=Cladophialophora yegresii CBS 114405 TaxID=1182544 RepID=W9VWS4_9EURO|nr:uncharacterized protein A1O7_04290 [Cladophialophora yegresii CBS 114405]EXJ60138.1 hypothetical protein A1O7_04290 [Cladophialophora yegresii CBS 114405]
MTSTAVRLTERPGSRGQIAHAFFGLDLGDEQLDALQKYFVYYSEELELLRKGISKDSWQSKGLPVTTYEDIFHLVDVLRHNHQSRRPELRQCLTSRFRTSHVTGLNRSIDLAIRLWLMVNTQDLEFAGLRHEATSVQWDDENTLEDFVGSLFPHSRWQLTAQSNRLSPFFTVAFMQDVCGLRIQRTTSLHDHLQLDRFRKELKIFPYKCHIKALIDSHGSGNAKQPPLIPLKVLRETKLSLDLLFPFWHSRTVALLAKEKQDFHEHGPFEAIRTLTLSDFDHWRDRLLDLHEEIFQAPPISWAQLWRDRRNPQQFWTFWIAMVILILTCVATVATIIQAWASLKALGVSSRSA